MKQNEKGRRRQRRALRSCCALPMPDVCHTNTSLHALSHLQVLAIAPSLKRVQVSPAAWLPLGSHSTLHTFPVLVCLITCVCAHSAPESWPLSEPRARVKE